MEIGSEPCEDVLAHVDETLKQKGYMVIAVAEGAGQELVATGEKDPKKMARKELFMLFQAVDLFVSAVLSHLEGLLDSLEGRDGPHRVWRHRHLPPGCLE